MWYPQLLLIPTHPVPRNSLFRLYGDHTKARETRAFSTPVLQPLKLSFLDRNADAISPFCPRAIIILNVLETQKLSQHKPSVARAFPDPAVNHRVFRRRKVQILDVNLSQFFRRLKRAVIFGRRFPRYAFCLRNMASAQYSFLRVLRHVGDLAFEFARRSNVDDCVPSVDLRDGVMLSHDD